MKKKREQYILRKKKEASDSIQIFDSSKISHHK